MTAPTPPPRPPSTAFDKLPVELRDRYLAMSPLELLNEAVRLAKLLHRDFDQMLGEDTDRAPALDLSGLSLDEKLALGEQNCRALRDIALRHAPERTLDTMDAELSTHAPSKESTAAVLDRLVSGG